MTEQPQHCYHECVCPDYKASHSDSEEDPDPCDISCYHRSRPAPQPDDHTLIKLATKEWFSRDKENDFAFPNNQSWWKSGWVAGYHAAIRQQPGGER